MRRFADRVLIAERRRGRRWAAHGRCHGAATGGSAGAGGAPTSVGGSSTASGAGGRSEETLALIPC
jgi:hypothetical protein